MRLLHTSDWHLGHTLHEWSRHQEHEKFLAWLLDTSVRESVDAMIVAGDIFDTTNPPAEAQSLFYEFIASARKRLPSMSIVIVGGNHDSAARLDAPDPILRAFDVRVVGGLPRRDGKLDFDRFIVPIQGGLVAAVPFLRNADLPVMDVQDGDPLIAGVRQIYADVLEEARRRRGAGQALVATGHLFMAGGTTSPLSERKILGGNQHALPVDIFPDDVAYVALGHLHVPQPVGGREHVRYSGSPIPLSMGEASNPSQVVIVELDGERFVSARPVFVPRTVDMVRVPEMGHAPLDMVRPIIQALPYDDMDVPKEKRPFLDVRVYVDGAEPQLRRMIELECSRKAVRLVGIHPEGPERAAIPTTPDARLHELVPEDVFRKLVAHKREGQAPSDELLACFHELLNAVQDDREAA